MKKILSAFFALMFLSASAQNKIIINDKNAEVRLVKDFHAIKVSNGIELYISYGDETAAVSASEIKYRDRIRTEVQKGVLKIWFDEDIANKIIFTNKKNLKAYVSYKQLDALTASSGADIIVDGTISANSLSMQLSSGSDFKGNVDVKELFVDQSSGSDIKIGGKADKVTIDASSGSDFNGYSLTAEECTAHGSSGSDINITINKQLKAHATSGSDIFYKGNASEVNATKSSGGSVGRKD